MPDTNPTPVDSALDVDRLDEILADRSLSLHTQRRLLAELRSARAARPAEPCEVVIEPGSPVTEQDIEAARAWTWPYAMPTDPEVRERLDQQLRAAIPGPDSERIREVIRRVLMKTRFRDPENMADPIVAALRAAGLLPGPDTITVNREALRIVCEHFTHQPSLCSRCAAHAATLRAALSEPPAPKEQQP